MTTAIIHHPVFEQHDTGPGHPESPERYAVVMRALRGDAELWPRLLEVEAAPAPRGDVQAAHTPQHFKHVERARRPSSTAAPSRPRSKRSARGSGPTSSSSRPASTRARATRWGSSC